MAEKSIIKYQNIKNRQVNSDLSVLLFVGFCKVLFAYSGLNLLNLVWLCFLGSLKLEVIYLVFLRRENKAVFIDFDIL